MIPPSADVYRAISDPTRRAILDRLTTGERSAGSIAKGFPISQPACSRHLRVLRDAGLVKQRREGRQQVYSLAPERLREIYDWVSAYTVFWESRLDALGDYLQQTEGE